MSYLFCVFYCRLTLIVPIRSILALSSRWSQSVRGNRYFSVLSKVWPVIENSSFRILDYEVLHIKLLRYNRKLLIISEARRWCGSPHPRKPSVRTPSLTGLPPPCFSTGIFAGKAQHRLLCGSLSVCCPLVVKTEHTVVVMQSSQTSHHWSFYSKTTAKSDCWR